MDDTEDVLLDGLFGDVKPEPVEEHGASLDKEYGDEFAEEAPDELAEQGGKSRKKRKRSEASDAEIRGGRPKQCRIKWDDVPPELRGWKMQLADDGE